MKHLIIILIFLCSCTGLRNVQESSKMRPLTKQTISSINGNYGIFTADSATTTLDHALTLKKFWCKDWTEKDKYSV